MSSYIEKIKKAGLWIKIWDITSEFFVPAFHCVIGENNPLHTSRIFRGEGCHLNKGIALIRAITEAAQSRLTMISGSRDDVFPEEYANKTQKIHSKQLSGFNIETSLINQFRDYSSIITVRDGLHQSFENDLMQLLKVLRVKHVNPICIVKHETKIKELEVVHTIIPGITH